MSDDGESDKTKTSKSKLTKQDSSGSKDNELQKLSVEALTKDSANKNEATNETSLPSENNAKVQLEKELESIIQHSGEALAKTQNKDVLPSSNTAEVQLENETKLEITGDVQGTNNDMKVATKNESIEKNDVTEVLLLECSGETGKVAIETEAQFDVINNVKSDVSCNKAQSEVISPPIAATTPSQVSVTFEKNGDANPEVKDEANCRVNITEAEQSVTMETATLTNYDIITSAVTRVADVIPKNDNEFHNSINESEDPNELLEDSNRKPSEVLDEDDDDEEMSWIDMSFSQPLVPQLSEVVRVGVIARVPEDYTPLVNNHVSIADGDEGSDTEKNVVNS